MKAHSAKRLLSLILALVLCFPAAASPALAADSADGASVKLEKVSNDTVPTELDPDRLYNGDADQTQPEDDDTVRVSILVKGSSVLDVYSVDSLAANNSAVTYRQQLRASQNAVAREISADVLGGKALDVVWNLTLAANIISANVEYGQIEQIRALPNVEAVVIEHRYYPDRSAQTLATQPNMSTSASMIGSNVAYDSGYAGSGMRIAIIDTGIDTDHQSFDSGALDYALEREANGNENDIRSLDLLDVAGVDSILSQLNISRYGVTAKDLYYGSKIPFAYNYVDENTDVTHDHDTQTEHGSHVAGISAANAYIPQTDGETTTYVSALDTVKTQGVAPNAQLLVMKVFGTNGGAYDSDYMAAIEDALLLGADSINLSIGSSYPGPSRYTTYMGDDEDAIPVYQAILDSLVSKNAVVSISAGNSGNWAEHSFTGTGLLYDDGVSMDVVGSPGSYTNAFTVTSVDNVGNTGEYVEVNGHKFTYMETTGTSAGQNAKLMKSIAGTYEYILIDGVGNTLDYDAIGGQETLKGKIVFCSRGELDFSMKANNAAQYGAAATIVYNNAPGTISMDLSYYYYEPPCVLVTQEAGNTFRANATPVYAEDGTTVLYYKGTMTVSADIAVIPGNAEYETMSSFASWGVPGSLELKPEITAPGGNIYSVNGQEPGGKGYENMSGTSMAAPQIAGMAALFAQYYETAGLSRTNRSPRHLAQSLLMSTAVPAREDATRYWSVLKQGAGVANIGAAVTADSYVWMPDSANKGASDGKVKVELGEDAAKNGVYSFSYTLYDLSGAEHTYDLSASFFTQAMTTINGSRYLDETTAALDTQVTYGGDADGSSVTVPANGSATVSVTVELTAAQKAILDQDYPVGAYMEGYVFAQERTTSEGVIGTCHSIPVLGFYGSWTDSSMFELSDTYHYSTGEETRTPYLGDMYRDANGLYVQYASQTYTYGSSGSLWGGNPLVADSRYMPERNAINSENGDAVSLWKFCAIRSVADSRLQIVDKTANTVLAEQTLGHFLGAFYSEYFRPSEYVQLPLSWKPEGLAEGTELELNLTFAPEYYVQADGSVNWDTLGRGATRTFTAVVDNTAPEILGCTVDGSTMTVSVSDNQYVAAVRLYDRSGTVKLAEAGASQTTEANAANSYTLDLSSANGSIFYLKAYDYAMNEVTYRVEMEIGVQPGDPQLFVFDAYYTGPKVWAAFSGSGTIYTKTPYAASNSDFYASAYVNGKILASTSTGELYALDPADPEQMSYIRTLDTVLLDMAYDQTTGTLYGVDANGDLYTVDLYTGALSKAGALPVKVKTLACDDSGNFYYAYGAGDYTYYKIYRLPIAAAVSGAAAEPEEITKVDQRSNPEPEDDFSAAGSLEWEPTENVLFFAVSSALHKISLTDKTSTECNEGGWGDYFPAEFHALCIPRSGSGSWDAAEVPVSVSLSDHNVELLMGNTYQLKASVLPWTLANRSVLWLSTNNSTVTVDENGRITALAPGYATILAISAVDNSVYDQCVVNVEQLGVTLTGMLQDANGKAQLFSWDLKNSDSWTGGTEIDTSMSSMTYDPVDNVYYVIDAVDRTMVRDESKAWQFHKVDPATGASIAVADNGIGVPLVDMAYSTLFSSEGAAKVVGAYRAGYFFKPFDPMDTTGIDTTPMTRDAITLPVSDHSARDLVGVVSLGVETHSSDAWYDGVTDWYGEPENPTWSGEYEAEHFALLDDAGYLWDLWICAHDGDYGFDYTTTKTPLSTLGAPPYDSTMNYTYCSLVADSNGDLYFSRFNGDTNEIYRLRKAADGTCDAVLLDNFGSSVWPALLGGVEPSKDEPVIPVDPIGPSPVTPITPPPVQPSDDNKPSRDGLELPFVDVKPGDWFYGSVKGAWQNYLIDGTTETTYEPGSTLTVASAIKLAATLHQLDKDGKVTLKNGTVNWYDSYVSYGVREGILDKAYQSYTAAQMNAPITRREFIHIFYPAMNSYAAINTVADNAIPDVKTTDPCADEIYTFYRAGILNGTDKLGTCSPENTITRSEVAAILVRMYDTSVRVQFTLK